MKHRLFNWINGLQWDWCISRQRFFGVPFPVWYCKKCGEVILAEESQLPVDPLKNSPLKPCKCGTNEFLPEKDVLDTWATSSLTPQIAATLVAERNDIYPMNLRPQAHDIISFWLFNTLVKSQLQKSVNPWKECMISGWVLAPSGEKMSKSKGNVIAPQDVMEKYGADALRFWACGSKLGENMPYQEKDVVTGQKFVNKLWNASKFTLMNLSDYNGEKEDLEVYDRWLLSKLNKIIKESTETMEQFEYSKTKHEVEKFFWHVFCDFYLEIIKDRIYNEQKRGKKSKIAAQFTLNEALFSVLKLMAPITPFITEEIYHLYFAKKEGKKSIHNSLWPEFSPSFIDEEAEQIGDHGISIIAAVRKFKSENKISLKENISKIDISCSEEVQKKIEHITDDLKAVMNVNEIHFSDEGTIMCSEDIKIAINK